MQEGHVVCFESQKLNEHGKNYPTHDLELAVIIHALKMWRHYLLGRRFVLMSDHSGLRYLFDQMNLNFRQPICLAMINEFDFDIKYIKGKNKKVADALSRRVQVNHIATMISYGRNLQDQILQAGQQDARYMELMLRLQHGTCNHDMEYRITVDGLVIFRDKIYVLNDNDIKKTILRYFHAKPYSDHPRYQKALTTVNKFYHWYNLKKDVVELVAKCFDYQHVKA